MIRLHFVFGPHIDELTAVHLARKLTELQKTGSNILFVGSEGSGTKKSQRQDHARKVEENAGQAKAIFASIPGLKQRYSGTHAKTFFTKIVEGLLSQRKLFHLPPVLRSHEIHREFIQSVALAHDVAVREVEFASSNENRKIARLTERGLNAGTHADTLVQDASRMFYDTANSGLERHKITAKNLAHYVKRYYHTRDGDVVLVFGSYNEGMQETIPKYLEKLGIPARVESVTSIPVPLNLFESLRQKKYGNPLFKPSQDELARAVLHNRIDFLLRKAKANEIDPVNGLTTTDPEKYREITLELNSPVHNLEYAGMLDLTAQAISGMTKPEIVEVLKNRPTIGQFLEQRLLPSRIKHLRLPEKLSALRIRL